LTDALFALGCNLLDSSMTLLRGEFAIILMVSLPPKVSIELLSEKLSKIQEQLGFTLHMRELLAEEVGSTNAAGHGYLISVYGADKPGIVSGITHKIAHLGLNITDVETKRTSGAHTTTVTASSSSSLSHSFSSATSSSTTVSSSGKDNQPVFIMVIEVSAPPEKSTEMITKELKETARQLGVDVTVQEWDVLEL
jgi:glycine cleavage system transcriptional repressor